MPQILLQSGPREYTRTNAIFRVELQGDFQLGNIPLECTITHRCEVKNQQNAVVIPKNTPSVFTLQGTIATETEPRVVSGGQGGAYTYNIYHYYFQLPQPQQPLMLPQQPPVLPQQPWSAPIITLPISLEFMCKGRRKHTQAFNIPINSGWFGEIQVALGTGLNRIESRAIPFAERSWGLPAVFGSARSPLGQLQEFVNARGIPPELVDSWRKIKTWLEGSTPRATYPVRANNGVKFYNDASANGLGTAGAFHDLYNAIQEARHFIFIADWSFHPGVYLKRSSNVPNPQDRIGAMLINKALGNKFDGNPDPLVNAQNMVIAIHTWNHIQNPAVSDDPDNNNASTTLDTISRQIIPNAQRRPSNLLWRATERPSSPSLKTHHQKFVVLDAPVPNATKREIKVFFGGLDLTTGRFDWPMHLLDDLTGTFKRFGDWYNPEFTEKKYPEDFLNLPRQPWHDIHAQLVGPTAWDFIFEFVGRWSIGAPGLQWVTRLGGDADETQLVWKKFEALLSDNTFVRPFDQQPLFLNPFEQRPFTAQVYRSMEKHYWHTPDLQGLRSQMAPGFLQWGLHKDYEKSIHKAYLQAIQRAENFIYIESQFLIAGDYCTETSSKADKRNHIPKALVNRIVEKHTKNEDFHVYILLPLFPEGAPDTIPPRPVRYFQWQTIRRMKDELVQRLQGGNNGKTWEDYLSFYFLGNRTNTPDANYANATRRRAKVLAGHRYMIYVHSKMMIVDDTWIIIGSANLNERSMSGSMDSEICVGMWASPGYEAACLQDIRTFRKTLWDEHLGDGFCQSQHQQANHPQQPQIYQAVQAAARNNLHDFVNGQTSASNPYPHSIHHLMLWDLADANFATMPIPDGRDAGDAWRVQPTLRGVGAMLPNAAGL